MNTPTDPARLHAAVFDHAIQDFLAATDRFLAASEIAPEDKAATVAGVRKALGDKLRLIGW